MKVEITKITIWGRGMGERKAAHLPFDRWGKKLRNTKISIIPGNNLLKTVFLMQ